MTSQSRIHYPLDQVGGLSSHLQILVGWCVSSAITMVQVDNSTLYKKANDYVNAYLWLQAMNVGINPYDTTIRVHRTQ